MPILTNLNASPYYDDFNANNNYYRILFKPSVAVQARELTQAQSILQDQFEKFGDSIYYHGSVVKGGKHFYDQSHYTVALQDTYSGVTLSANSIANSVGLYAVGRTTNNINIITAYVLKANTSFPNYLLYKSAVGKGQIPLFNDNEVIDVYTDYANVATLQFTVQANSATSSGYGSTFFIDDSIYYVNGTFVRAEAQRVVVNTSVLSTNAVIGYTVQENLISALSDSSLYDNAIGSTNYNAPGADRLQIKLVLTAANSSAVTTNNFVAVATIQNGLVQQDITTPLYSVIGDTMARRTFETSGDFTTTQFNLTLKDVSTNDSIIFGSVSPGTAFVKGYEYTFNNPLSINLQKARATESATNAIVTVYSGNYTKVQTIAGKLPDINTGMAIEIHNAAPGSVSSGTKIGTGNIRNFSYDSNTGVNAVYGLSLYNLTFTGNTSYANAKSIIVANSSGGYTNVQFSAYVLGANGSAAAGNNALLYDTSYNTLIFPIGETNIANTTYATYQFKRKFSGVSVSGGAFTLTCSSDESFIGSSNGTPILSNYSAVVITKSAGASYSAGVYIPLDTDVTTITNTGGSVTLQLSDATFVGNVDVVATIQVSDTSNTLRKTKTLSTNAFATTALTSGTNTSLGVCDIYALDAVYDIGSSQYKGTYVNATSYSLGDVVLYSGTLYQSNTNGNVNGSISNTSYWFLCTNNIIYNFTYDDGQKDSYYDFGVVTYNGSVTTGNTVIVYDYFTHSSGNGFFSVDSYTSSGVSYGNIPAYTTSKGNILQLRDCYDFRPRRTDGSGSYVFNTFQIPNRDPSTFLTSSHSYYLKRIDKIILNKDGKFIVKSGTPGYITPQYPADEPDGLTMFILSYPAYTYSASSVAINTIPHKRYTMQDIGSIDQRLSSVEYYTALTLSEQQLQGSTFGTLANSSLSIFKNGYLVDAFAGHSVGDVTNPDYKCSIDYVNNILKPSFSATSIGFNTATSANVSNGAVFVTNNHLMLSYTEKPFISQTFVTDDDHDPNPIKFRGYHGKIKFTPDRDYWFDDKHMPQVFDNKNDSNNNWVKKAPLTTTDKGAFGTEWDHWHTLFKGVDNSTVIKKTLDKSTPTNVTQTVDQTLAILQTTYNNLKTLQASNSALVTNSQIATAYAAIVNYNSSSSQNNVSITGNNVTSQFVPPGDPRVATQHIEDNRVKNDSVIFYCRRNVIVFEASGLAPNTKHHMFVNGLLVTSHCRNWNYINNTYFDRGIDLISDRYGRLRGELTIPNADDFKFSARKYVIVELSDSFRGVRGSTSYADGKFHITRKPDHDDDDQTPIPIDNPILYSDGAVQTFAVSAPPSGYVHLRVEEQSGYDSDDNVASSCKLVLLTELQRQINLEFNLFGESYSVLTSDINTIYGYFISYFNRPACIGEYVYHLRKLYKSIYTSITQISTELSAYGSAYTFNSNNNINGVTSATASPIGKYNPLATSFYVDPVTYPNGLYITSVDLAITQFDDHEPVCFHIRDTDDDRPAMDKHLHHSHVWKHPFDCKKYVDGDDTTKTNFKFSHPIFLKSGQKYAFVLSSNSPNYRFRGAIIGKSDKISGKKVSKHPWHCHHFKPNLTKWDPDDTVMITYTINQAVFTPKAIISYPLNVYSNSAFNYNTVSIITDDEVIPGVSSVKYEYEPKSSSSNILTSFTTVTPNENTTYNNLMVINQGSGTEAYTRLTLTTTDTNISPIVNLSKLSGALAGHLINNDVTGETNSYGGNALAKYETKPVTLISSVSANSLRVWLDLNLQYGTYVQVYYKILNNYDGAAFTSRPWVKMPDPVYQYVTNTTDYIEHAWALDGITYTSGTSTYPNFNTFAIKVVMLTSNLAIVPNCQNLRVIAASS
jgi:hypothetical protein